MDSMRGRLSPKQLSPNLKMVMHWKVKSMKRKAVSQHLLSSVRSYKVKYCCSRHPRMNLRRMHMHVYIICKLQIETSAIQRNQYLELVDLASDIVMYDWRTVLYPVNHTSPLKEKKSNYFPFKQK